MIQEKKKRHKGSKLDPYRENIRSLIDEHNVSAVRILEEIRKTPLSHFIDEPVLFFSVTLHPSWIRQEV